MEDKCTDSSYKCSHQKSAKSFTKAQCKALDIKQPIGQNSQLHSFTASQLHSFTASQLHSFTAEGKLCPNKFKYQLLKPRPKTACRPKTGLLSLGFFIYSETGEAVRATVIAENKPARLMAIIPADLPADTYYIEVRTKIIGSSQKSKPLKTGRFDKPLTCTA